MLPLQAATLVFLLLAWLAGSCVLTFFVPSSIAFAKMTDVSQPYLPPNDGIGSTGLDGNPGPQGDRGWTGATGPQMMVNFLTGDTGPMGRSITRTGPMGVDGVDGSRGPSINVPSPTGIRGATGSTGLALTGITGFVGLPGPAGPTGPPTLPGPTGATGFYNQNRVGLMRNPLSDPQIPNDLQSFFMSFFSGSSTRVGSIPPFLTDISSSEVRYLAPGAYLVTYDINFTYFSGSKVFPGDIFTAQMNTASNVANVEWDVPMTWPIYNGNPFSFTFLAVVPGPGSIPLSRFFGSTNLRSDMRMAFETSRLTVTAVSFTTNP